MKTRAFTVSGGRPSGTSWNFAPACRAAEMIKLTTNYRSHRRIIEAYDRWMASADWSNPQGLPFRYDKTIEPDADAKHPEYPAIFSIWGRNKKDEAERFADMVAFLKEKKVIEDYSQVALLLHSVRLEHSGHYLEALRKRSIPAFCPRARAYFDNEEIRLMVGCFAVIFGYYGDGRGEISGPALQNLAEYVDESIRDLARRFGLLIRFLALQKFAEEISKASEGRFP